MKFFALVVCFLVLFSSCDEREETSDFPKFQWENRLVSETLSPDLLKGSSYLSVYSHIYSKTEHVTHDLTVTISLRNPNPSDKIFINSAKYFNTSGKLIRTYFDQPIYLEPMETVEIVINQDDNEGGSGANFIFDWQMDSALVEPIFEAIMISTYGQQGLSFSSQGIRIK